MTTTLQPVKKGQLGLNKQERAIVNLMREMHETDRPFILIVQRDGKNYRLYNTDQKVFISI